MIASPSVPPHVLCTAASSASPSSSDRSRRVSRGGEAEKRSASVLKRRDDIVLQTKYFELR